MKSKLFTKTVTVFFLIFAFIIGASNGLRAQK